MQLNEIQASLLGYSTGPDRMAYWTDVECTGGMNVRIIALNDNDERVPEVEREIYDILNGKYE